MPDAGVACDEFEVALVGSPADVAAVRDLPCVRRAVTGPGAFERVVSQYFDDRARTLACAGVSLRLRDDSDGRVLVAKSARINDDLRRREVERPFGARDDLRRTGDAALDEAIARAGDMRRVARIDVARWSAPAALFGGRIEIAVDIGEARNGVRVAPVSEVELERMDGPAAPLFALARAIVAESAGRLRPVLGGKLSRIDPRPGAVALATDEGEASAIAQALWRAARLADRAVADLEIRRIRGAAKLERALAGLECALAFWPSAQDDGGLARLRAAAEGERSLAADARALARLARRHPALGADAAVAAAIDEVARRACAATFSLFRIDLLEACSAAAERAASGPSGPSARSVAALRLETLADALAAAQDDAAQRRAFDALDVARRASSRLFAPPARRRYAKAMKSLRKALTAEEKSARACRLAALASAGRGAHAARAAGFIAGVAAAEAAAHWAERVARRAALVVAPRYWREKPGC